VTDLVIRPLAVGEEPLFDSLADPGLVGPGVLGGRYFDGITRGTYRTANTWVALRDGVIVARAAWWGRPDEGTPAVLDWLDFTDPDAAVQLLRTAPGPAEYSLALPPDWRRRPAVAQAAQARIAAAEAVGMTPLVERYGYRWTTARGLPARPGRLQFRPEPDDAVILDIFRRVRQGSLDRIVANTDVTNLPMAATFAKAGYPVTDHRIDLVG
jgi:hypothetical protein